MGWLLLVAPINSFFSSVYSSLMTDRAVGSAEACCLAVVVVSLILPLPTFMEGKFYMRPQNIEFYRSHARFFHHHIKKVWLWLRSCVNHICYDCGCGKQGHASY